ncbi:MAG: hypothetical protein JWQ43_2649 [Glaciihabitans sp.]|nr:hypothetical protein [Glaciihabitans sp.]
MRVAGMRSSDDPPPPRRLDDEILAGFGAPVFEFVDQSRLQLVSWGTESLNSTIFMAEPVYWVADASGDFHFMDTPMGPFGQIFDGHVHTDIPGSTHRATGPVRGALEQHLSHHVVNFLINEPSFAVEFGSPEYQRVTHDWYLEVETLGLSAGSLTIDGADYPAESLAYRGFSATACRTGSRIVTVVVRDVIAQDFDLRLRSRTPQRR